MSKQELYITGWGDARFNEALQTVAFLERFFSEKLPSTFIKLNDNTDDFRSFPIFSMSNRFFTLQDVVPYEHLTLFPVLVDPSQLLFTYARRSYRPLVNIAENNVDYFQRVKGASGLVNRYGFHFLLTKDVTVNVF